MPFSYHDSFLAISLLLHRLNLVNLAKIAKAEAPLSLKCLICRALQMVRRMLFSTQELISTKETQVWIAMSAARMNGCPSASL